MGRLIHQPIKNITTMSYTIMYRSMFVKMSDGKYIPLVEMGDNNVWECGNRRRARGWQQIIIDKQYKKLAFSREEIMQHVENMIDAEKKRVGKPYEDYEHKEGVYTEQEIEKCWGYYSAIAISGNGHCNNTSAQQFRNFILKGFDQAVSFDADCGLVLDLHWCTEYPHWEHRYVKSEQELLATWEKLNGINRSIWVGYHYCADRLWERHRKRAEKKLQQPKNTAYVVKIGYRYVAKLSSRRLWHNSWMEYAKRYATRQAAEKVAERIRKNYSCFSSEPEVLTVRKNGEGKWQLAA